MGADCCSSCVTTSFWWKGIVNNRVPQRAIYPRIEVLLVYVSIPIVKLALANNSISQIVQRILLSTQRSTKSKIREKRFESSARLENILIVSCFNLLLSRLASRAGRKALALEKFTRETRTKFPRTGLGKGRGLKWVKADSARTHLLPRSSSCIHVRARLRVRKHGRIHEWWWMEERVCRG